MRQMFCASCFYPLDHLAGRRCPECGRPFDPADPSSVSHTPNRPVFTYPYRTLWSLCCCVLAFYNLGLTGPGWTHKTFTHLGPHLFLILVLALGVGTGLFVLRKGSSLSRGLAALSLLILVWYTVVYASFLGGPP